jgi:myo-inositol-1(or 4)-monophosphatase
MKNPFASRAVAPFSFVQDSLRTAVSGLHPCFLAAVTAAHSSAWDAVSAIDSADLAKVVRIGADGTPTSTLDAIVEDAILNDLEPFGINVLSEEAGFIDRGSALTFVMDPVDGTANAIVGVPAAGFAGALAVDATFTQAAMSSLTTGAVWAGIVGKPTWFQTSGCVELRQAAVSMLRPHVGLHKQWWSVAQQATRVRILSTSIVEAGLVAQGSIDAFLDAGSDTHRLVDLAAPSVLIPLAGGAVVDVWDRPLEFDVDLTRRWSGVVAASHRLAREIADVVANAIDLSEFDLFPESRSLESLPQRSI